MEGKIKAFETLVKGFGSIGENLSIIYFLKEKLIILILFVEINEKGRLPIIFHTKLYYFTI